MRRPRRLLRCGFALQAILLLAIQLADGSGVHRCPDHDSGLGILALGPAPAAAHHHGGHHDGSGRHQGLCPCLGACHSATVGLAPAGAISLSELPAQIVRTVPAPVASVRPRHNRRLPFSIGPPTPVPSDFA
jgi:hypothetical protein